MTKISEITLAIPFYNTSSYFEKAVELALNDDFVKEIVVNDDHSSEEEWDKLNKIVHDLNISKIKLFRNETNLGGFRNKYVTVKNSTCQWVYLLDSDNYPAETTFNAIKSIKNPDPNVCYAPHKLFIHGEDGHRGEVIYDFKYEKIGVYETQDALLNKTVWFDWFLNTGNFIFNRIKYLERIPADPLKAEVEEPVAACSIAFSYYWIREGGFYKIISEIEYYHRLRSDSYWNTCGANSFYSVEFFKSKFLGL